MTGLDRRRVAAAGHTGRHADAEAGWASDDPHLRAIALGALDRLGVLDAQRLRRAIGDTEIIVRRRGAIVAAHHPDVDLIDLLGDDDATVVEAAAWACGEQVEVAKSTLHRLVELARHHTDALVRESAVAALGAIGDADGFDAITAGLSDVATVRRRAVLALAPFVADEGERGERVEASLDAALADRDWQVRQAAEDLRSADPARHS